MTVSAALLTVKKRVAPGIDGAYVAAYKLGPAGPQQAAELLQHCVAKYRCMLPCRLGASAHNILVLICGMLQTSCSHSFSLIAFSQDRLATPVDAVINVELPAQPTRMAARLLYSLRKVESI